MKRLLLHNSFYLFQPPVTHQHEEITSFPPTKSIMFLMETLLHF